MPPVAAAVEETTREGYPALRLSVGELEAIFCPRLGMIGASLTHRGEELLGQRKGLPAYEERGSSMGIPLLHPWANRLAGLEYEAAGQRVTIDPDSPGVRLDPNGLPIHGLLAANPGWRVEHERSHGLAATFDFGRHPKLLEAFPFPHELHLAIELSPTALTIATTLEAGTRAPVPVSFGFHPYLTLPGVPREDWHVELPVDQHLKADERGIPTGEREPADEPDGPLSRRTYDDGYALAANPAAFALEGGDRRIELIFERGYPFAQVFAPPGEELICFEPMTAPTNALTTGGPALPIVEPGNAYEAVFRIAVNPAERDPVTPPE
jgi:galactose mutarotase-like enzyme